MIARRLCTNLITFFLMAVITFTTIRLLPGDPFLQDPSISQEMQLVLQKKHGLDRPLYLQFTTFLAGLCTGHLGYSYHYPDQTVEAILSQSALVSFHLGVQAFMLAVLVGLPLGVFASLCPTCFFVRLLHRGITLLAAMPSFVLAVVLQKYIAGKWDILPVAMWNAPGSTILPSIALSIAPATFLFKISSAAMTKELTSSYVLGAQLRGISQKSIVWNHAFRNIFPIIIPYLAPITATLLAGSLVIEKIFAIPGIGRWAAHGIATRDYPVIVGVTIFYGALTLIATTLSDFFLMLIDPRIRYEQKP